MQEPAAWRRPGILVGKPVTELPPAQRALLLTAVCVLAGRDPDELDSQLAVLARAGPSLRRRA